MERHYDVAIVGGGIIGTSILYVLSRYTGARHILLIEKESDIARVTSSSRSNSQTLHVGDIETNYSIEKIKSVKSASSMLLRYVDKLDKRKSSRIISQCSKMIIGIGAEEAEFIEKRYDQRFLSFFPGLVKLDRDAIAEKEPNVIKGRDKGEMINGVYSGTGHMVAFDRLAKSFVESSLNSRKKIDILLDNRVNGIRYKKGRYAINVSGQEYTADALSVCAGTHSLRFAKSLGYGKDLSMMAVAGNFYNTPKLVNGKVYTVQKGEIPFLGVHADPDINHPRQSRFGPTITPYPFLEKSKPSTFVDYLNTMSADAGLARSLLEISKSKQLMDTFANNILYALPGIGKNEFLNKEARRIIPLLKASHLREDKSARGIRAQPIDKKKRQIVVGEVELRGDGAVFNISPSPGASSCLRTAMDNAEYISKFLDIKFDKALFNRELGNRNA